MPVKYHMQEFQQEGGVEVGGIRAALVINQDAECEKVLEAD